MPPRLILAVRSHVRIAQEASFRGRLAAARNDERLLFGPHQRAVAARRDAHKNMNFQTRGLLSTCVLETLCQRTSIVESMARPEQNSTPSLEGTSFTIDEMVVLWSRCVLPTLQEMSLRRNVIRG